jgi:hypothetical protein
MPHIAFGGGNEVVLGIPCYATCRFWLRKQGGGGRKEEVLQFLVSIMVIMGEGECHTMAVSMVVRFHTQICR